MSREYFVTKLMAGKAEASAKTRWWPRHSRAMARYLQLSHSGHVSALEPERDLMARGCAEWEATVCRADGPGLMERHVRLEMRLVDAALRGEVGELGGIGTLLTENVKGQTDLHAALIPEFPAARWRDLFAQHVWLYVESISSFMKPDNRLFRACEERRRVNTLALAAFTAEWL